MQSNGAPWIPVFESGVCSRAHRPWLAGANGATASTAHSVFLRTEDLGFGRFALPGPWRESHRDEIADLSPPISHLEMVDANCGFFPTSIAGSSAIATDWRLPLLRIDSIYAMCGPDCL